MAGGIVVWLFEYTGGKVLDAVLSRSQDDSFSKDLHKAVEQWAKNFPDGAFLTSSYALFPSHVSDSELGEREALGVLRSGFRTFQSAQSNSNSYAIVN